MDKEIQKKITNRHVAKVLSRLAEIKMPEIVLSEIKRQMWFLSDDLVTELQKGKSENE